MSAALRVSLCAVARRASAPVTRSLSRPRRAAAWARSLLTKSFECSGTLLRRQVAKPLSKPDLTFRRQPSEALHARPQISSLVRRQSIELIETLLQLLTAFRWQRTPVPKAIVHLCATIRIHARPTFGATRQQLAPLRRKLRPLRSISRQHRTLLSAQALPRVGHGCRVHSGTSGDARCRRCTRGGLVRRYCRSRGRSQPCCKQKRSCMTKCRGAQACSTRSFAIDATNLISHHCLAPELRAWRALHRLALDAQRPLRLDSRLVRPLTCLPGRSTPTLQLPTHQDIQAVRVRAPKQRAVQTVSPMARERLGPANIRRTTQHRRPACSTHTSRRCQPS